MAAAAAAILLILLRVYDEYIVLRVPDCRVYYRGGYVPDQEPKARTHSLFTQHVFAPPSGSTGVNTSDQFWSIDPFIDPFIGQFDHSFVHSLTQCNTCF